MRLFCVLLATLLGCYMVIRSTYRLWKRGRDGVNVTEDPSEGQSAIVDIMMLMLGVFLLIPLFAFLLN